MEEEKKASEIDAEAAKAEEEVNEEVFKQANDLVETVDEQKFTCTDPMDRGGHIVYKCRGADNQGQWEGERRYNNFFNLREKLEQRWPGIPIPQLPPKKVLGSKGLKFINERRFYLERFLKKMATFPFLVNSNEFQAFSRPQIEVDKAISGLPKPQIPEIVDRMRTALKIEEHMYNPLQKDKLDLTCKHFQHFAK